MAARVNQSSIRYSDEVKTIVNKMNGETFADRFENMVLRYANEEKELEKRLQSLQNQIKAEQEKMRNLSDKCYKFKMLENDMTDFYKKLEGIKKAVDRINVTQ